MNGEFDEMMLQETTWFNQGGLCVYSYYNIKSQQKFGFKIHDGSILRSEVAGFDSYSDALNAMYASKKLLKGENEMVGTLRSPQEEITISPTRTYVIVVHDVVCPNEARFMKINLPESFENNSKQAKYYYHSINQDRASLILASVAWEDYIGTVTDIVEEVIFTPSPIQKQRHFDTRTTSLAEDMKEVRQILDAWNDEQEMPSTTYSMILKSILRQIEFKNNIISEVKEALHFAEKIRPKKDNNE